MTLSCVNVGGPQSNSIIVTQGSIKKFSKLDKKFVLALSVKASQVSLFFTFVKLIFFLQIVLDFRFYFKM